MLSVGASKLLLFNCYKFKHVDSGDPIFLLKKLLSDKESRKFLKEPRRKKEFKSFKIFLA